MNGFLARLGITSAAYVVVWACAAVVADDTLPSAKGKTCHVWEKVEIVLAAKAKYENPYTEVTVWVDLKGPGFAKRCYGFWDGGDTFRVRVMATAPGTWSWKSGSKPADPGLEGVSGSFTAVDWTEAQKAENPSRRGMIRPSANGHAFQYADGTPFLLIGDTWWATPTFRFRWRDDDTLRPLGPEAGFKEFVAYRRKQEFNCVAILAALPNWANDDQPATLTTSRRHDPALGLEAGGNEQRQIHDRRSGPSGVPAAGQGPRLREVLPGRGAHRSGVLSVVGQEDRLPERPGIRPIHRSRPAGHRAGVEEVLSLAAVVRAVHRVHLEPLSGEHLPVQSRSTTTRPARLFPPPTGTPRPIR